MKSIDPVLEQRVWQRVYGGKEQPKQEVPLEQLMRTALDCAGLYHCLDQAAPGKLWGRYARQMLLSARRLAFLSEGRLDPPGAYPPCPNCSHRRRRELALLWMERWTQSCQQWSRHPKWGQTFAELTRLGQSHCRSLKKMPY